LIRLIIFFIGVYIGYRILKKWMTANPSRKKPLSGKMTDAIDDIMIKDPVCQTYFPKKQGIHHRHEGQNFYFCSVRCRDRFLEMQNRLEHHDAADS
jgi:YHS domain-containing protein